MKKQISQISLILILIGIFLYIIPSLLGGFSSFEYIRSAGFAFVIIGGINLLMSSLRSQINEIANLLELKKDDRTKLYHSKGNAFQTWKNLRANNYSYIITGSILINDCSLLDLQIIEDFFIDKKIDSDLRLLIYTPKSRISESSLTTNLKSKFKEKVHIRIITSETDISNSMMIIDRKVWVIFDNKLSKKSSIILETELSEDLGNEYISHFNKLWEKSEIFGNNHR